MASIKNQGLSKAKEGRSSRKKWRDNFSKSKERKRQNTHPEVILAAVSLKYFNL
jgi:hypothetical protein